MSMAPLPAENVVWPGSAHTATSLLGSRHPSKHVTRRAARTDVHPTDAVRPRDHEAAILAASNRDVLLAHRGRPGSAWMGAWNASAARAQCNRPRKRHAM